VVRADVIASGGGAAARALGVVSVAV